MSDIKLPIGIQDFETIISEGYVYVDKTKFIYELISQGIPYFLSRPRRFGKSLLVSTFEALFLGKRHLFKGLWIDHSDWDWMTYPIIRLDMSTINNKTSEMFELDLIRALNDIALQYKIKINGMSAANYLENLIIKMSVESKIVVLIDEYDKSIIDNIDEIEIAKQNRRILHDFYTILKAQGKHLKFVFLTGITKFSKVSVFSGLNNLKDITMLDDYSAILGYTQQELKYYFAKNIQEIADKNKLALDECYTRIKEWYNGYKFSKNGELVYNPFSTLNLIDSGDFSSHWFATGTPSFLINLIKKREFDLQNLEEIDVSEQSFTSFDIENLSILPLLYQTGYLTIKSVLPEVNAYRLGLPNREVNQSFSDSLLEAFAASKADCHKYLISIAKNLCTNPWQFSQFFEIIQSLLALIPYDLYVKDERHYHSLCYLIIKLAGFQINSEVHTHQGRADAALVMEEKIIIFEFKLNKTSQNAIDQIKEKKYYQLYQDRKLPIYLVGINFNGEQRMIDDWKVELY